MLSNCNFTMNGGEVKNNKAETSGGAIYGYDASVYTLNGGEMSGNYAAVAGAIYPGNKSTINISNQFKLINNTADEVGAIRLTDRTVLNMTGGVVSGNVSLQNEKWNAMYGWNPIVNISGGVLADNINIQGGLIPTVGGNELAGIIYFDLSTNHNTCYLNEEFGVVKFYVAEGSNFAQFNFHPVDSYTYNEGDENKLICLNDGYTTYYDASTNTFRLKTIE